MANLKDFATALIQTAPSPATSGTSLVLASAMGVRFPAVPFNAVAHPDGQLPTLDNAERVTVTAVSTDTLTIVRAQGNTTAKSIAAGWRLSNAIFADDIMYGSNVFVNQETPSGSVNSTNKNFTASRGYISGTLMVFVNGLLQAPTTHVTEVSPSAGTFSLDTAPLTGDIIRISYYYSSTAGGNAQTVNGIAANTTPTANQIPVLDGNGLLPTSTLGGAWQSWTPTITNSGGTITATTGFAKYIQIGKTIHFKATINISSVSAAGSLRFTPPVAAAADQSYVGSGREDAATGKMVEVMFKSTTSYISLFFYDNTGSTATAGYSHVINGTYEAA